jgi:probable F420-dependent oxidoreductase
MKWGIVFSSTMFPDPERAGALGEIAEEAGFDVLCAPEHIVIPVDYEAGYGFSDSGKMDKLKVVPDPLIWFAYVAARTTRIKFCTGVMLLTERNPLHTAKEAATLDLLSGGRLQLGVGSGWCKEEYDALGVSWPNRGRRLEEYMHVLRALWADGDPGFKGEFVNFDPVQCYPKPVSGTIPLHIGGNSEAAARRAGRMADGYFPALYPMSTLYDELPQLLRWVRESAADAGRDLADIEITSGGVRTAEDAKWFADQGVHRLTVTVRAKTISDMRSELMRFGEEVIEPTQEL